MIDFTHKKVSNSHQIIYSKVNYNIENELFKELSNAKIELTDLNKISNASRKIEWMTTRFLLLSIYSKKEDIVYNSNGKPFLKNSSSNLSISHSKQMVAISINELNITGIDIQFISDKIIRIKHKFLNEKEQTITDNSSYHLTAYWSIKEALFKIYGKKDAFLKENIEVTKLDIDNKGGTANGIIQCNGHYSEHKLELKRLGNYIMAYTVNH